MNKLKHTLILCLSSIALYAQSLPEVELNKEWKAKMEKVAPSQLTFPSSKTHNVLIFSLHTGFKHWVIPHTEELYKILTTKTGGFNLTATKDIKMLSKANLKNYDAVILNNTCSIGDHRDMFWDVLKNEPGLDSAQAWKMALKYEKDLIKYVKKGGGILAMHGGIVMQNKSAAFSEMMGGSFNYHPKQQKIEVELVDASHPLVSTFGGAGFTHIDEPYTFNNAYSKKNFKPLMYYEAAKIVGLRNPDGDAKRYVSWIKRHGKGRIFYSSPSHNAQSFDNPKLLQYFLNGLQYVVGDVDCDDSPMGAE
jgi:uncharacterized protein